MISTFNSTAQTVEVDSAYVFDTNRIITGCTVGHTPGTATFILNKPGYYYVTFNTVFTTGATGVATVELQNDGITIPGALGSETITTVGDTKSISFSTIVKVLPSCAAIDNTAVLTFVATGIELQSTAATVNITKLC
jgi:hypothetical protein